MLLSLLVLDAGEPRRTGMDIWRESGSGLTVLMPAPQKTFTRSPTPKHTSALPCIGCPERYDFPPFDYLRSRSSLVFFLFPHRPSLPKARPLSQMSTRREGEWEGSASSVQRNGAAWIASLPPPVRVGSVCVFCLGLAPPAGLEIRSKSHRSSSV